MDMLVVHIHHHLVQILLVVVAVAVLLANQVMMVVMVAMDFKMIIRQEQIFTMLVVVLEM